MLGVPQEAGVRYHNSGNGAQPCDDLPGVFEATHMGVTGGKKAMRVRQARILLNCEEQLRHCLIEATANEMRGTYYNERRGGPRARAEP